MDKFKTVSLQFANGRIYFVGRKEVMWHITEYFDRNKINNGHHYIEKYIDMAIEYNIYMGIMSKKLWNKIFCDCFVKRRLNKYNLFIPFEAYMEAMCFNEEGRKEVKRVLDFTDDELDDLVKKSEWNKAFDWRGTQF